MKARPGQNHSGVHMTRRRRLLSIPTTSIHGKYRLTCSKQVLARAGQVENKPLLEQTNIRTAENSNSSDNNLTVKNCQLLHDIRVSSEI